MKLPKYQEAVLQDTRTVLDHAFMRLQELGNLNPNSYELAFARREIEAARLALNIWSDNPSKATATWNLDGAWTHAQSQGVDMPVLKRGPARKGRRRREAATS